MKRGLGNWVRKVKVLKKNQTKETQTTIGDNQRERGENGDRRRLYT